MAPIPAIAFENVSKAYGPAKALDRISLAVGTKEFLAIVGQSGSGKTTLLSLINRLAEPSEGTVRFAGEDVRTLDPIALRRRIGYVFQGIGLFPHMSVAENIAITPRLLGWEKNRIAARVGQLLELVQLPAAEYRDRMPRALSGGQRQRVGVARALAAEPRIVLMDEPFGALDALTRDALGQEYRRLHEVLGLTSVMITHDMLEAMLLADRIAILQNGRLIEQGTPQDLIRQARHPYVRELMQAPRRQADRVAALMDGRRP
jgi:osmoprotectant transport system ATP-binding protein